MKKLVWLVLHVSIVACIPDAGGGTRSGGSGGSEVNGGSAWPGSGGAAGVVTPVGSSAQALGAPAEITSVLLPQINPAWPLGEWTGSLSAPKVIEDCGGSKTPWQQVYVISVTAGSGLDFAAKRVMESGVLIGDWAGVLSDDRQSILVPAETNNFTDSNGALRNWSQDPLTFKLVSAGSKLTARLYASAHYGTSSETCSYQLKDYELTNSDSRMSNVLQGTTSTQLDAAVALKRWGSFPVSDMGLGLLEASFRHAVTPILEGGDLPEGIVLDDKAWAVKVATNALWFYVILGYTNKGEEAVCMKAGKISSVENSANLPVHKSLSSDTAAPTYVGYPSNVGCLRPGERAFIIGSVSVDTSGSAAFGNAAIAKISPPTRTALQADRLAPTPYKVRHATGSGMHVDVIDAAYSIRAVYLDAGGLPVGTDFTYDFVPSTQSNQQHLVYTYSFAEPEILGKATTVLIYTTVSS